MKFLLSMSALGYLTSGIVGKPYSEGFLFVLFSLSCAEHRGDALQIKSSREFARGS